MEERISELEGQKSNLLTNVKDIETNSFHRQEDITK